MRLSIIASAVAVLLGGCASPAERERARQDPWAFNPGGIFKKQATWDEVNDGKCRNFGAVPGTSEYVQCRIAMEQQRVVIEQQQQQDRWNALGAIGQMQQNNQPQVYQPPPQWLTPPAQNTWCRRVGQQVSCTTQ